MKRKSESIETDRELLVICQLCVVRKELLPIRFHSQWDQKHLNQDLNLSSNVQIYLNSDQETKIILSKHQVQTSCKLCTSCHSFFNSRWRKSREENPPSLKEVEELSRRRKDSQKLRTSKSKKPPSDVNSNINSVNPSTSPINESIPSTQSINNTSPINCPQRNTLPAKFTDARLRELIASLIMKRRVSFEQVEGAVNDFVTAVDNSIEKVSFSTETAKRIICEMNVCLDVKLIEKCSKSKDLGWGMDETPHQEAGRSFMAITVFGTTVSTGDYWRDVVKVLELSGEHSKTAESMMKYLLTAYEELKKLAKEGKLEFKEFYEFNLLHYDNTSSNTGDKSGLGVLFDLARKKDEKECELDPKPPFLPTICEGCMDHQSALYGKRFAKELTDYLKTIRPEYVSEGKYVGFKLLKLMSIHYGVAGAPNKGNEFEGHRLVSNIKKKIFFYISKNRYLTYELLAKNIIEKNNYECIKSFLDKEKKAGVFDMSEYYHGLFENPDILFIFRLMSASVFHSLKVMKYANEEHTLEEFTTWIENTIKQYEEFEKNPSLHFQIDPEPTTSSSDTNTQSSNLVEYEIKERKTSRTSKGGNASQGYYIEKTISHKQYFIPKTKPSFTKDQKEELVMMSIKTKLAVLRDHSKYFIKDPITSLSKMSKYSHHTPTY